MIREDGREIALRLRRFNKDEDEPVARGFSREEMGERDPEPLVATVVTDQGRTVFEDADPAPAQLVRLAQQAGGIGGLPPDDLPLQV